jgi:hypothetical protein
MMEYRPIRTAWRILLNEGFSLIYGHSRILGSKSIINYTMHNLLMSLTPCTTCSKRVENHAVFMIIRYLNKFDGLFHGGAKNGVQRVGVQILSARPKI